MSSGTRGPSPDEAWVVLHVPTDLWWRPRRSGYCKDLFGAGVYTEAEARQCERTRSPQNDGMREDRAMPLLEAVRGLGEGTVGALLGLGRIERVRGEPCDHMSDNCTCGPDEP